MTTLTITTSARLHLGFLDLHGGLGRRFGSLGLAIDGIYTRLSACTSAQLEIRGAESVRAAQYAQAVLERINAKGSVRIDLEQVIAGHAGLGSGTQLALGVGRAVSELYDGGLETEMIAMCTQRGTRSGIGIGIFDTGGLVIDAGRGADTVVPRPICRLDFPTEWPIVLIRDPGNYGISGEAERNAFSTMAPMAQSSAEALCRHTLMGIMPSVVEKDFSRFAQSLQFIQDQIGSYFAPYQGEARYSSHAVATAVEEVKRRFQQVAVGQTSWGPTGFVFCQSSSEAESVLAMLGQNYPASASDGLIYSIHRARNVGAVVEGQPS